jgi:uncharacterized protein involved in exopolysaccharide biosynthesis
MTDASTAGASAPAIDLREKLRSYLRHRRAFYLVTTLCAMAAVALAVLLPPTYSSSSTILIEQQEIPQDLVRASVTSFADQRLQVINQRVMTTQNLMTLIERYDLYPEIRLKKSREELLQTMRDAISMRMISADVIDPRSGQPTKATIAFSIGYKSHSAELALKVANDLTTLYLNENLNSRTQKAEQTAAFFAEESARQQAKIDELDKKLADFKLAHQDRLPEDLQPNMQVADRTRMDLRDAENKVSAMEAQKVLLEAQLTQINPTMQVYSDTGLRVMSAEDRLKALKSQLAGYKARYAPGHPDIISTEREIEGLEKQVAADDGTSDVARQLEDAKQQLARAREKYAPEHPDVVRLTHTVSELEKTLAASPAGTTLDRSRAHPDNPPYIQVKGQLDALAVEYDSAQKRRDELQAKLDDYERRIAQSPAVERDYRELAREFDTAQIKYQEIRSKQSEVQVSQNLEKERKGERFTMIEPPLPPEKPISPNRILILSMGFVLSLGAGLGAAILLAGLDASVRGVYDMRVLLDVPPLAAIPTIVTRADRRRRRLVVALTVPGSLAGLLVVGLLVHLYVRPLDVLWIALVRRFGV